MAENTQNNRKRAEIARNDSEEVNKQLQNRLSKVERFNNLMFKQENRIIEIKDEVNLLLLHMANPKSTGKLQHQRIKI